MESLKIPLCSKQGYMSLVKEKMPHEDRVEQAREFYGFLENQVDYDFFMELMNQFIRYARDNGKL